jgi:hypothetical protein
VTGRPRFPALRGFWWADRALRAARRGLSGCGRISALALPVAPRLPAGGGRGVEALLRLRRHTCLEEALVRQRFLASHGACRDIVIGVRSGREGFVAHAWLEGGEDAAAVHFHELTRLPA